MCLLNIRSLALLAVITMIVFVVVKTGRVSNAMNPETELSTNENPLLMKWEGPYGGVPPFDRVQISLFKPALETAMAEQLAETDAIAKNTAAPDFENTIAALERSGMVGPDGRISGDLDPDRATDDDLLPAVRAVAEHDVARTANLAAALTNHFLLDMSGPAAGGYADLTAPALIVHGDRDPVYPLPHGRALQAAIPDAELLVLPDTGHDLPRPLHDRIVAALLRHTRR